jgi:thioredoxin reductase (NADPH)
MKKQASTFGCTIRSNVAVTNFDLDGEVKTIEVNGKETFCAPAIILAMGGRSRMLSVPGEQEFKGKGISYCATCDGDFFQDKDIIVVGGGNSALEEAVSLTKYARSVTIVHQFDEFQAFAHAIEEARANAKISFIMQSTVTEFMGNGFLQSVKIRNLVSGEITERAIDGVFIFIGYVPNTEKFVGRVQLNSGGEVVVNSSLETNVQGVYAAGDSIQKKYRQVTTAVADGTIAALSAIGHLHNHRANQLEKAL